MLHNVQTKSMRDYCTNCTIKETCRRLCDEAENHTNIDYVPMKDLVTDPWTFDQMPDTVMDAENSSVKRSSKEIVLSYREYQIVMLLILTKSEAFYLKCREYLSISEGNAWKILQRVRERLLSVHT